MKYLALLILTILLSCEKSVDNDIDFILFEINSWKQSNHKDLVIFIEKEKSNSSVTIQYLDNNDSLITKRNKIDHDSFKTLAKQCNELENINIKKAYAVGLDGKDISIEFGIDGKSLKYYFHEPNNNSKERDLEKFINLSEKILLLGNLNTSYLE